MSILTPYTLSEGYIPGFVELNSEDGILDMNGEGECQVMEDAQTVPETLALHCFVRPLPRLFHTPTVHLISEGQALAPSLLYADETVVESYGRSLAFSQWRGIALAYQGAGRGVFQGDPFGFQGFDLTWGRLEVSQPLYVKPFVTESQDYQVRMTTIGEGQVLSSPPEGLNTKLLRGYGGYYQPGIPLEQIEQVYYSLTSDYEKTRVRLYSSGVLRAQHTPPPQGGRDFNNTIVFQPTLQTQEYMSLSACLEAGYATFSLVTPWGAIPYRSCGCKRVGGEIVEVMFSSVAV